MYFLVWIAIIFVTVADCFEPFIKNSYVIKHSAFLYFIIVNYKCSNFLVTGKLRAISNRNGIVRTFFKTVNNVPNLIIFFLYFMLKVMNVNQFINSREHYTHLLYVRIHFLHIRHLFFQT